jgi:hypothetical protein
MAHWTYRTANSPELHDGEEWFNHSDVGDGDAFFEIRPDQVVMYGR